MSASLSNNSDSWAKDCLRVNIPKADQCGYMEIITDIQQPNRPV